MVVLVVLGGRGMETVTDGDVTVAVTVAEGFFLCWVEGVTVTGGMGVVYLLADAIGLLCVDVTVVVAFPGAEPLADLADLVCI